MNTALLILQDTLAKQNKLVRERLVATDDAALAEALTNEMFEISHRIQLTGSLLFADQSKDLDDAVDAVKKGTAKVEKAIATIESVAKFLNTMSDFLALVDEALDLAKKLMV